MKRTTRTKTIAMAFAVALGLSGCSSGAGGGGEHTLVDATGDLPSLNPMFVVSPSVQQVGTSMLEPLVRITDDFEIKPGLATSWEFSDNGNTATFKLRDGVKWHDGKKFTSADVKFNLEEIVPLQSAGSEISERLASVEAPDATTVVLRFKKPYGPLLPALTQQFMVPKHLYEGTNYLQNPANNAPVGTGPMKFESFTRDKNVVVVKNPDYWGGEVKIDKVVFAVSKDPNARDLALLAGEIDRAGYVGTSKMQEIKANPDLATTKKGPLPQQMVLVMSSSNPVLKDPKLRQLVYSAIDKQEVSEKALPGTSTIPHGMFPPSIKWAADPETDYAKQFPYDVDAINKALDEAGYPRKAGGTRFTLDLHYYSSIADAAAVGEVMKSTMARVGINVDLKGEDTNIYGERVYAQRNFDMAIVPATVSTDPSIGVTRWYTCNKERDAAENASGVCDPQIEKAADGALSTIDKEERAKHFHAMQKRVSTLMMSAPIVYMTATTVYNKTRWNGLDDPVYAMGNDWLAFSPKE